MLAPEGGNPQLWIPGKGLVPAHIAAAEMAVKEYDPDLRLAQDMRAGGQWVIAMRKGPDGEPFPVLGLGHVLPSPEAIKDRLYKADTRRRAGEIARDVDRHNEAVKRRYKERASEGSGIAAEAFEWAARKEGIHPNPRIFVPGR